MKQDKPDFKPHPAQKRFFEAETSKVHLFRPFVKTDYNSIVNAIKEARRILAR